MSFFSDLLIALAWGYYAERDMLESETCKRCGKEHVLCFCEVGNANGIEERL